VLDELVGDASALPDAAKPSHAGALIEHIKKVQRRYWKI
jgi:hypothetical protein